MSDDLLIKISADVSEAVEKIHSIGEEGENLENKLGDVAKISAVAFAALAAQVALSVKAFADSENASLQLGNALQNQGIYTDELKESYKSYVDAVSASTGLSKDQLTQAQAVAQTYLGQIPITKQLTQAIADYSTKAGGLTASAEDIAKAIGNGTGMLLRQGLQFSATDTEAQRYQKTVDFITAKYGGMAAAVDPVTLATRKLEEAFHDNQVELGSRFAPAVATAIDALTSFIQPSQDASGVMVDVKASVIAVGLAFSALAVGIPALAVAFNAVRAALIAMNTQLSLTQALLAGLGIGLLAIAVTELVLHFKQVSAVVQSFIRDLGQLADVAKGVGSILQGAFTFNPDKIKEGLKQIGDAFKKIGEDAKEGWNNANKATEDGVTTQIALKKQLADKEQALRNEQDANRIAIDKAQRELTLAELHNESDAIIQLKKEELQTLEALSKKHSEEETQLLHARLDQIRADEQAQMEEDKQIQAQFQKQQLAAQKQHGNESVKIETESDKKRMKEIQKNTLTEKTAQKKVYEDDLKTEQAAHNTFLQEQIKYGTAYAAINEAMHSAVFQGSKQAFGDLAQLQQSSNSTLKEIGKVAAIANIVIKTAESAMNIYAGFSTIPIIGPALGIAGAAAAVAFGVEQVGKVSAAQTGAYVDGVGFGDKYPYMLEAGELVAPRKSFDEVVEGVAQQRGYQTGEEVGAGSHNVAVTIGFDGRDAQQVLTARRVEDQSLGVYRART